MYVRCNGRYNILRAQDLFKTNHIMHILRETVLRLTKDRENSDKKIITNMKYMSYTVKIK